NTEATYDQLAHQVAVLRKENCHLRRELEDNSHQLSKLETETFGMKEVLKQLQSKLEQEAGTLASSGRSDILHQLRGLNLPQGVPPGPNQSTHDGRFIKERSGILMTHGLVDVASPKAAVLSGLDEPLDDHHLEQLYMERNLPAGRSWKREERERCWFFSQIQPLQNNREPLKGGNFSLQMDLIRQQLEFEAQQVQSVMEERFGTNDEMIQRTQMRAARLEQLEKELQEARGSQDSHLQVRHRESIEPDFWILSRDQLSVWLCQTDICVLAFWRRAGVLGKCSSLDQRSPRAMKQKHTRLSPQRKLQRTKVEMVLWLLSILTNRDKDEMSRTLLALSSSPDSCVAMRKSGCVPLLVQVLHDGTSSSGRPEQSASGATGTGCSREARSRASATLHNIIFAQQDEGQARREKRVLHLLEQIRTHCDTGRDWIEEHTLTSTGSRSFDVPEAMDPQICQAVCAIMKLSFEEEYRHALKELEGGLHVIAELIHLDQETHGTQNDPINMALRRYAGMAMTNLTYGDVVNKATLCSKRSCLQALVAQLASDSEELHQVVSSILRNLSWRADVNSKRVLRDIGCVSALMTCALQATKESTLKSILSALWNLSAHSIDNKVAICSVDGALSFLVSTLTYRCQTNSLAIIESGGGILRNVSSLVATREDYRQILRDHNCLQTLLQHLRSHSLTIVSNACGTLWNLSARSSKDQELLWELGAVSMLRNLIHSKHKMIAMGSAAALRNLLSNRPLKYKDTAVVSPGSCMPSLYMRKQKALEAELDAKHLAETFDIMEKQNPKHLTLNKPLRHIESLAKDYASDSGCFDDDEAPSVPGNLDSGSFSMLSMFLTNSNLSQTQQRKRDSEAERDEDSSAVVEKKHPADAVSAAAEKLAQKITNTVAKIDRLVDDITMHTSSEDSFSLCSEDHLADWPYRLHEVTEQAKSSSLLSHLSDTSSVLHRERLSRAHALLRLKTAHSSLSTDSLNSGSTSDGYCGSREQLQP
uniref:APC regulator of WNT signaling pathway 2 n=1 Tax=Tetraodon nigroviridis TaxID=99883 RepID=H3BWZ5_TETNG